MQVGAPAEPFPFTTLDLGLPSSQDESDCRQAHLSRLTGSGWKTRAGTSAVCSSWTSTALNRILPTAPGCT